MEIGDIVRLKQPFRPQLTAPTEYGFGMVVGVTYGGSEDHLGPDGVIVNLYDPELEEFFVDELGVRAEFQFYLDEIAPQP